MAPNGDIRIQYGQVLYSGGIQSALAGLQSESFVKNPQFDPLQLIGFITVRKGATNLSLATDCIFQNATKFGELAGGGTGLTTTTLQAAYNNSTNPEIFTNSTLGAVTFKNGGTTSASDVIEVTTSADTQVFKVDGSGQILVNKPSDGTIADFKTNGTSKLTVTDSNITASTRVNFADNTWNYVGNDVMFGDINQTNTLGIRGQSNSSVGYIRFGTSGDIGFDGTNIVANGSTILTSANVDLSPFVTLTDEQVISGGMKYFQNTMRITTNPNDVENNVYLQMRPAVSSQNGASSIIEQFENSDPNNSASTCFGISNGDGWATPRHEGYIGSRKNGTGVTLPLSIIASDNYETQAPQIRIEPNSNNVLFNSIEVSGTQAVQIVDGLSIRNAGIEILSDVVYGPSNKLFNNEGNLQWQNATILTTENPELITQVGTLVSGSIPYSLIVGGPTGGSASNATYSRTFTSANFSSNVLTVTHNLSASYVNATVFDNSNKVVVPTEIVSINTSAINIDFTGITVDGTWNVVVLAAGAGNSVYTNATLSGVGTSAQPLGIAPKYLDPISPVITRTNDVVTRIDYAGGKYKTFTYTNGLLTRIDYNWVGGTIRKVLTYTNGILTSISQSDV